MVTVVETEVTNISLVWQPPLLEHRNGIIQGFVVRISSISGAADTRQITTAYTNITVTSLTPYTVYECVVSAYTAVGTGPSSNIILARTQPTSNFNFTTLIYRIRAFSFFYRSKWHPIKHNWTGSQLDTHLHRLGPSTTGSAEWGTERVQDHH